MTPGLDDMKFQRWRRLVKFSINEGGADVHWTTRWFAHWRDPYHLLLMVPWPGFALLLAVAYVVLNSLFALAYLADMAGIGNARPGSFADAFFFSVQTFSTVGYGNLYPLSLYVNLVTTLESLVGLVCVALLTGLTFTRFTRPRARIIFSKWAVVTAYEGMPTLMFRAANQRFNKILEAQIRVYYTREEVSIEGKLMRRFYELSLVRNSHPNFSLSWSVMHPIHPTSPFYEVTPATMAQENGFLHISLSGLDETVYQNIYTRHTYTVDRILWNHRLEDMVTPVDGNSLVIDTAKFHAVVPEG